MLKRLMDIAGGLVGEYAEYIAGLSDRKVIMGFNMTVSELLDFPEMNEMEFEDE